MITKENIKIWPSIPKEVKSKNKAGFLVVVFYEKEGYSEWFGFKTKDNCVEFCEDIEKLNLVYFAYGEDRKPFLSNIPDEMNHCSECCKEDHKNDLN